MNINEKEIVYRMKKSSEKQVFQYAYEKNEVDRMGAQSARVMDDTFDT